MGKIKRLKDVKDVQHLTKLFNKLIGYSNVPWEYFASGRVYGLYDNKGRLTAGFVLVPGYRNLRAIAQLPPEVINSFEKINPQIASNLCDFTGYFITKPKDAFWFTAFLTWICLWHPCKYFVYTYPIEETNLEKYYGQGKPLRVYTGEPVHLPGHAEIMHPENVEILSRWGIVRIFLCRTRKLIFARLKCLLNI